MRLADDFCRHCETWVPTYCPECVQSVTGTRLCRTRARHQRMAPFPMLGARCASCRTKPPRLTRDEHLHQLWMVLGLGD